MYDEIDRAFAYELGIKVEEYVDRIERTTLRRTEAILDGLFSEDSKKVEKAKRVFNLI